MAKGDFLQRIKRGCGLLMAKGHDLLQHIKRGWGLLLDKLRLWPGLPVLKREWMAYFRSPVAYVFIVIFLLGAGGMAWYLGNFYGSNQASLDLFFFFHPWLYLVLAPAVGMRLWAEEQRAGTLELLATWPVGLGHVVLAKFLAAWLFMGLSLALTFPMVLTVLFLGDPDGGVIITGYFGSFLMAGAYLAISCFTSTLTKNQVISFITSVLICLLLVILGLGVLNQTLAGIFPAGVARLISAFSFSTHFDSMQRGLIDLADVSYFISIIVVMLLSCLLVLERRRG